MAIPARESASPLPASFVANTEAIAAFSCLDRLYRTPQLPLAAEPLTSGSIDVLWTHSSRESAFHERLFSQCSRVAEGNALHYEDLEGFQYCELRLRIDLKVATLYAPDRRRLQRLVGIESAAFRTDDFIALLHAHCPDVHGVMWTSQHCDPDTTLALFISRLPVDALELTDPPRAIAEDAPLRAELQNYANRAGIKISPAKSV